MNSTPTPARDAEALAEREAIMAEGMTADELAIAYSWGRDANDAYPKQRTAASFRAFAKYVCDHRAKQKGQLYFCAPFAEQDGKHHRCKDDASPRRFLPLDLDYIPDGEALADLLLALQPYRHFAYTTASHTPELPRIRVVLELSRPVPRDDGVRLGLAFQAQLAGMPGLADIKFDTSVYRAEQPCFGPLTGAEVYPRDRRMTGAVLDVDELLSSAPEIPHESSSSERAERIAHDDPKIAHLYEHGFVLETPALIGKLPIRCPNAAAHSHETGPTSTVVLLPHFNGVVHAKIKCLHESCASITQEDFWRLAGYVDPGRRGNGADAHHDDAYNGVNISGALLHAMTMPDLEFVSSPILTKGQLGTITAHPGAGKTTFFTGLCVAHALDLPFGPLTPETKGLVYIVSAEDFQGTRNRILAEAARLRLDDNDRRRLNARLRWAHVETSVGPRAIRESIDADAAGDDVALIFVDTGPALFTGDDENDNVALRNFVEGFAAWRFLPGMPVIVLAWHPSKSATADRLEPRGASAIKGTCDFNLTLWKDEDRVTLGYTKVRAQHFDPIEGRISSVELVSASGKRYLAPVVTLNVDERTERSDAGQAREAILRKMHAARDNPPVVRDLATAAGISRAATYRHLQHLATSRPALVTKDPVDDRYTLTKPGQTRAKALAEQAKQAYQHVRDPE